MDFRVLGPLEVGERAASVAIGGGKQRVLLALLLSHARQPLSTDWLIDALWGETPPASAGNSVHVYVSQLRKALGDGRLRTSGRGYVLDVGADELDAERFDRLVVEGRVQRAAGDSRAAIEVLSRALALWRGPAFGDLTDEESLRGEVERLEELRLDAVEERIEAELDLRNGGELVPELEALVRANPLRERFRSQLMLALYRRGRQADALEVYRDGRRMLRDELGLEPGPELQRLERAILSHDAALAAAPARARPRTRRGAWLVAGGGALLLAVIAAVVVELPRGGSGGLTAIAPNSLGILDPGSRRLVAQVPAGIRPGPLASANGSVWVANVDDRTVSRIDARTHALVRTIPIGGTPAGVAAGGGGIWVSTVEGRVYRIEPRFDAVRRVADVSEPTAAFGDTVAGVATGLGAVWVADRLGLVSRLDRAGRITGRFDVGFGASGITVGARAVWVTNSGDGTISRIDPAGATTRIPVGHGPAAVVVGAGSVWVVNSLDDTLIRIDPGTNAVVAAIPVGRGPTALAVGAGAIWVAAERDGTLLRVDPGSNRVVDSVPVQNSPVALGIVGGSLWVSVDRRAPATPGAAGGVVRIETPDDPGPLDPAYATTGLQFEYLTGATLMNYPDRPAPEGARLVPEVAQAAPSLSGDGRRYTFVVRPGFRFSPPSNEPVTARTFKYAIERSLDPRIEASGVVDMSDVVGVKEYRSGKARHIRGVIARGRRLTIVLKRPLGDLPARLSTPAFAAVPLGAPVAAQPNRPLASAGPYYVSSYTPGQELVLRRNPRYGGDRPRRFRQIDIAIGVSQARALSDVESGVGDYAAGGIPPNAARSLRQRYGPGSAAARDGRQRYFVNSTLGLRMLALNTSRPLFSDPRLRRAVAYAIDRSALADQERRFFSAGPFGGGGPTDAYLPHGMPGASRGDVYPVAGPNLARARALVDPGPRRRAIFYTCNKPPCPQQAAIVRSNLRAIGIDVEVREFSKPVMYTRASEAQAPYDILTLGWSADYADPGDFLNSLLDGRPPSGPNFARFDEPPYSRQLRTAARLSGAGRYRVYGKLARELARHASPLVVYESDESRDFFSARIGCQVYQPVYGMDLAALCLRH